MSHRCSVICRWLKAFILMPVPSLILALGVFFLVERILWIIIISRLWNQKQWQFERTEKKRNKNSLSVSFRCDLYRRRFDHVWYLLMGNLPKWWLHDSYITLPTRVSTELTDDHQDDLNQTSPSSNLLPIVLLGAERWICYLLIMGKYWLSGTGGLSEGWKYHQYLHLRDYWIG